MTVRRADTSDLPVLRALWEAFEAELPEPLHRFVSLEEEWKEAVRLVERGLALLAEEDGDAVGYALADVESASVCCLSDLYVVPEFRREGIAKELIAEVVAWAGSRGTKVVTLEVLASNADARAVYARLGFEEESHILFAPLEALSERLVARGTGRSYGSIHVQTDDLDAVARAVRQFVPRLPGGSRGSVVLSPRNGWTAVYDELTEREPEMLRRLALELSDRMGAVVVALGVEDDAVVRYVMLERGSLVDEYLSVPEHFRHLPPGDVIALNANPTVAARLTGADPQSVREVARTASSPTELPPAQELLAGLALVLGLERAGSTYAEARNEPDAVILDR